MNSTEKGNIGEQAVNTLAFETYLKYWCFPNPKDEKGSKKEICDLLILFRATAVIVSIKNYSFDGNYDRYFRSTLDKAISQIQGAERKLFYNKETVYIKHPDLEEQEFEKNKYSNIFRIIVNLNTIPLFYPLGKMSKNGYIHIFNWASFFSVVNELDTIPDLIDYLDKRQKLFIQKESFLLLGSENDWDHYTQTVFLQHMNTINLTGKPIVLLSGDELDLLADYYFNDRKFNKEFYKKEYSHLNFALTGKWETYISRKEVQRKLEEDRISYFVDEFVKRELLWKTDLCNIEIATELLSLSRFERRLVGKQFFDFLEKYKNYEGKFTARRFGKVQDITIGFMLYSYDIDDRIVADLIKLLSDGFCMYNKYKNEKLLIISVSNELNRFQCLFTKDIKPFSQNYEEQLKKDMKMLNWFENIEEIKFIIKEYPD